MKIFYILIQCTWGIIQSFLGFIIFLLHINCKHYFFHGAIITTWKSKSSLSLGMFVFITKDIYFYDKLKDTYSKEELSNRLLIHEYGHTIQSIILGPLYLIVIGIPSTYWGFSPRLNKLRTKNNISYFSFFTEKWANNLGEKITKKKSMEQIIID